MGLFDDEPNEDDQPPDGEGEDDDTLSKRDIREELYKAQQDYNRIQQRIERRRKRYQKLLTEGSDASEHERRLIAHRARMEKFKAEMLGLQRLQAMRQLNKYTLLESKVEAREFMSDFEETSEEISMDDIEIDFGDVGEHVKNAKAKIKADMMEMKESMEMVGSDVGDLGIGDVAMREEELMDRINNGETDPEEISFDIDDDIGSRVESGEIGDFDEMMEDTFGDFEDF